ncbi:MAG: dethiobiotin synthase [Gammaproteobacteria bacterium]|nr:dethiobiotin synthase [Gammaproteobacteria bacterium]
MEQVFITGTDTGVGKTRIAQQMLRDKMCQGLSTVAMKPVASGAQQGVDGVLWNEDALALMAASSLVLHYEQVNPYVFEPAIAPHIAAQQAGVEIDMAVIEDHWRAMSEQVDFALMEGVGGWQVPINLHKTMADLVKRLDIPVVLVVGLRLGCINHALLSYESIIRSGCECVGWVANSVEAGLVCEDEIVVTLERGIGVPMMDRIGYGVVPVP